MKKTKEKTQEPSSEPQAKKRKTEGVNSSNFISICLVSTSPITSVYMNSYLHTGSVWLKLKPAGNDHITGLEKIKILMSLGFFPYKAKA